MKPLEVQQSLPICCSLAALGGVLEVAATAVTALPAVREKQGIQVQWWVQWLAIAGNVGLQAIGSLLSHLIATWFGPVSYVVPFFYSSTLLSNVSIFGLLGERFTKNMRVGTHVIVVAVVLLPVVGPNIQEKQDLETLLRHWYSMAWFVLLLFACSIAGTVLAAVDITQYDNLWRLAILLTARTTAISANLSVSRAFILGPSDEAFLVFVCIKLISGAIYTYAIVVQSYAVEQATFVPLNATIIIIVNALTGVIIWEDWKVVSSWYGYVCIFVLLGLGCDLLLSVPMLNSDNPEFGANKRASIILRTPARMSSQLSLVNRGAPVSTSTRQHSISYDQRDIDAWKSLVSPHNVTEAMFFQTPKASSETPRYQFLETPTERSNLVISPTACLEDYPSTFDDAPPTTSSRIRQPSLTRRQAWRETVSPVKSLSHRAAHIPNIPESRST